uniref:Uncharacterized protein n=1 Tax=Electrophorus electricus TaxID=8005 RepID=A0AAY5EEW3_ELEEL
QLSLEDLPRPRKRLTELMIKTLKMEDGGQEVSKQWGFRFLRSPVKVLPGADGKRVAGIRLAVNKLEGSGEGAQAIPTGHTEDLECGMVICSIGYKSLPIDPALLKVLPGADGKRVAGIRLYCSGWLKRGPTGVIATTMMTVLIQFVKSDMSVHLLMYLCVFVFPGVREVSFSEWEKINSEEAEGRSFGKPREKLLDVEEMLAVAWS